MLGTLRKTFNHLAHSRQVGPEAEEVKAFSEQFYVTLCTHVNAVRERLRGRHGSHVALEHITSLIGKRKLKQWTWRDAYEVEQQLIHLYDPRTLTTELERRVLESRTVLQPPVTEWYQKEFAKSQDHKSQRALLLRLVNDLQWRYTINEAARSYKKQIARRTGWIFSVVILLVGVIVVIGPTSGETAAAENTMVAVNGTLTQAQLGAVTTQLGTVLTKWRLPEHFLALLAGIAGLWGAAFSMLTSLQSRIELCSFDDLKLARSWGMLFARLLVGAGAAGILYFFIVSELIDGQAFPETQTLLEGQTANGELAKLVVWCFLAGFSEKLVPGLLAKTESKVAENSPHVTPGPHSNSGDAYTKTAKKQHRKSTVKRKKASK